MTGRARQLRHLVPGDVRLFGGVATRAARRLLRRDRPPQLTAALRDLAARWPLEPATDDPVFVLSAGWRSGSTLLQRLTNSSREVLVWGEPFLESGVTPSLARSLLAFDAARGQFDRDVLDHRSGPVDTSTLAQEWTARLGPSPAALIEGHRALYRATYAAPAQALGYRRWGLKEVNLTGQEARYLRMLFPAARIVFLTRHPVDAWRSYRPAVANPWYYHWPDRPVVTPFGFAAMWSELAGSFLAAQVDVGALHVRYEDLTKPATLTALECHLGLRFDRDVLTQRVGTSLDRSRYRASVPGWERAVLLRRTGQLAEALGHEMPAGRHERPVTR